MNTFVEPEMSDALAEHVLETHVDTPAIRAFYLRRADGSHASRVLIVFTREGIVILGDLCPMQNGVISRVGYGIEWFAGRLSEQYLCSKFLTRVWVPELGAAEIRRRIVEARRDDAIDQNVARIAYDEIGEALRWGGLSFDRAYDVYTDAGLCDLEDAGHDYEPSDAGWLCAIQQRFAQLYSMRASVAA